MLSYVLWITSVINSFVKRAPELVLVFLLWGAFWYVLRFRHCLEEGQKKNPKVHNHNNETYSKKVCCRIWWGIMAILRISDLFCPRTDSWVSYVTLHRVRSLPRLPILRKSHHWPWIGKRQNLYRIEWQTVIKMRVTSFILALSLLCEQPFNYWNMLFLWILFGFALILTK